jgi:hypothetical protein
MVKQQIQGLQDSPAQLACKDPQVSLVSPVKPECKAHKASQASLDQLESKAHKV